MTKDEIIEKLKKLRRLADDGIDGEKDNARRRVEELMAKYGITDDDLADEKENLYTYYIDGIFCWDLKCDFDNLGEVTWCKDKINDSDTAYFSEEHIREVVFASLLELSEFAQSSYGINITAGTTTENIMKRLKGGSNA